MKASNRLNLCLLVAVVSYSPLWVFAADTSANLFVVAEGAGANGSVLQIAATGAVSTVAANLAFPRGIAADSQGNIFVGLGFNIERIAPNGSRNTLSGADSYFSLEVDRNDVLYAASSTHVDRLTPAGTFLTFATGLRNSGGMAFDRDGNLYKTDNLELIHKFATDGTRTTFATGLANPIDIVIDSRGDLFVSVLSDGAIYRFTPAGVRTTFATGLTNPWGLARDADDNIYVAELTAGRISKISPAGARSTFASGLARPQFMVFYPQPYVVPEPSSVSLASVALATIFIRRRRSVPHNRV